MFKQFAVTITYYNRLDMFCQMSMVVIASNPQDARDSGYKAIKEADVTIRPQTITVIMEE